MNNERKYKFVNKEEHVAYDNLTEEELEILNKSYRKETYFMKEQPVNTGTSHFSEMQADEEDIPAEERIADPGVNVSRLVEVSMMIGELLGTLDPVEKEIVVRNLIEGYQLNELEEQMPIGLRQIKRKKKAALEKMRTYLEKQGISGYYEALRRLME